MDTSAFFARLEAAFPADPQDCDPIDPQWQTIVADVSGFTARNELAVLNLAATCMPSSEAYLEVGTYKGRSICAAVQNNVDKRFYAVENFLEFGMAGQLARDELTSNLERYAAGSDIRLVEGDCFKFMSRPGAIDRPVGVYFYDGEHTLLAHYLALAVVEPLLADEALVLVDDATWPMVGRAHALFMRTHPGWRVQATWDARQVEDPRWANGLHALVFHRVADRPRTRRVDEVLRLYETGVQRHLNKAAWRCAAHVPEPAKDVVRAFMARSRAIGTDARRPPTSKG
ncbi:class I SAM-dependent methyltransferase [Leekyejoonella antrihumi]|uniref:Class I SAM-dependent methyltransferase n=1 Tax=Leekyejoonella antrihumi TaxID=1660198 RepID=A0A563E5I2_9MICO|nr:class I SAM-dependent methyltransferase [Leekyejoonella antrihumi]TWP37124.1 class I SAM-dependent methyltransferase [Leekyejoonella antrihumi]